MELANPLQVDEPGSLDPHLPSTTAQDIGEEKQVKVTKSKINAERVSPLMN